jgi:hypothetical protein
MKEVTIIGVDLAKNVFQLHGAAADGAVVFRKKLSRPQFHRFMSGHPHCVVAMEACGGAHHWAREMDRLGHEVRLVAPRYAFDCASLKSFQEPIGYFLCGQDQEVDCRPVAEPAGASLGEAGIGGAASRSGRASIGSGRRIFSISRPRSGGSSIDRRPERSLAG